jgi:hypothetical protein
MMMMIMMMVMMMMMMPLVFPRLDRVQHPDVYAWLEEMEVPVKGQPPRRKVVEDKYPASVEKFRCDPPGSAQLDK